MFFELVEIWKPLGYYYKCTIQDVFCILILQLSKIWKFKIETTKLYFLKINTYSTMKCQTLNIGTIIDKSWSKT
jgi:hypothetical protein